MKRTSQQQATLIQKVCDEIYQQGVRDETIIKTCIKYDVSIKFIETIIRGLNSVSLRLQHL